MRKMVGIAATALVVGAFVVGPTFVPGAPWWIGIAMTGAAVVIAGVFYGLGWLIGWGLSKD